MSRTKPRICLIEPCHSHEEVLLPIIDLLRDDYDVHVIAPQSLLDVDILKRTQHLYTSVPFPWNQSASRLRRLLRMPGKYREMRCTVDKLAPEAVLFNSTHSCLDLLLIATFFKGVRKAQIIHGFHHFLRPGMRMLYNQFDLNLVISEQVHGYVTEHHPAYGSLEYVLPIFFDRFEADCPTRSEPVSREDGLLQLGVFGSVGGYRRNYDGLFKSLASWCRNRPTPGFVVHVVGKLPTKYREYIRQHNLGQVVRHYEEFVSFEEMFRVLRTVDIVLFLVDSSVRDCAVYNRYKITGSSTLIKGFRKACAASRDFQIDEILADKCFYYDGSHIEELFDALANGSINREAVRKMEARYDGMTILSREEQKKRLVGALKRVGEGCVR